MTSLHHLVKVSLQSIEMLFKTEAFADMASAVFREPTTQFRMFEQASQGFG